MIKAIFFDIDWTLYDHATKSWDEESLEVIRQLAKRGVKVFPCSARPYDSLKRFGVFDLHVPWSGFIGSSGGIAKLGRSYIRKVLMDPKRVNELRHEFSKRHLSYEIISPMKRKLINGVSPIAFEYYDYFKESIPTDTVFHGGEVTGFNLYCHADSDGELLPKCSDLVYLRYMDFAVDIFPGGHEKGEAIAEMIQILGIKKEETLAFGDDLQDISMADAVGTFVCMENGKDEVKKVASYITKHVRESGVGYYLKTHFADICGSVE